MHPPIDEDPQASVVRQLRMQVADLRATNDHLTATLYARDTFLAMMSHELRTPLSSILGLTEILQDAIYGPILPRQHEALTTIGESGEHLLSLINDLLDLAKIESGHERMLLSAIQPAELIATSLSLVQPLALARQVCLVASILGELPQIYADARRLKQILVNLLANAIKFTRSGGEVGIAAHADGTRGAVVFEVWDSGVGIPESQLSRLFLPFVQLNDVAFAHGQGGTGLGLALVARLVEMHGGGVALRSAVGTGSRFTVTLPMEAQIIADHRADEGRGSTDAPLVLVAGGEHAPVAHLARSLLAAGYRCAVVGAGMAALERARAEAPAAMLVDRHMAGLGGLEYLRRLRSDPALAGVPTIMIGATTVAGDAERARDAGARAYLGMPIHMPELLAALAEVIGGSRGLT
ncbi:MAG: ATP-binding protein [Chloroflexales bacterium]